MRLFAVARQPLNDAQNIVVLDGAAGKEAVDRALLVGEDFKHALQLQEDYQLDMRGREMDQCQSPAGLGQLHRAEYQRAQASGIDMKDMLEVENQFGFAGVAERLEALAQGEVFFPHRQAPFQRENSYSFLFAWLHLQTHSPGVLDARRQGQVTKK